MSVDTNLPSHSFNKIWELSLYELHRNPQAIIEDDSEITISTRSLNSELMCPICLDMLKNTMTTKECLHRFCQECIITALRSGNKECPTCRKKLVSKRSLRPDPNFDAIIAKIHPYREEYELQRDKKWAKISSQTIKNCIITNKDNRLDNKTKTSLNKAQNLIDYKSEKDKEIELVFKPHPDEVDTDSNAPIFSRYIKTTTNATVEHLAKYLTMRVALEQNKFNEKSPVSVTNSTSFYSIYIINKQEEYCKLDTTLSLGEVHTNFWISKKPMLMYYLSKKS